MKQPFIYKSLILLFLAVILLMPACQKRENYSAYRKPVPVGVMVAASSQAEPSLTYIGKVSEGASLSLRFPLGGKVTGVYVHTGSRVREGELLAKVDDTQQRNAYNSAKATLEQAEDGYRRLKKVYDEGALAEVKWVEIQTQLQKAKSTFSAAEQQLRDCSLHAPQSGVIEQCDLHTGQQLLPSQSALKLINTEGVEVVFSVPEREIQTLHTGDKAEVVISALNDKIVEGKVGEKSMTGNLLTHSYEAKIALPNKGGELLPGMMCKVRLLKNRHTGFVIPASCVQTRQQGKAVWVIKDGKATRKDVKTAIYVDGGVLVTSGIEEGDTIVTTGMQKLWQGAETILSE